MDSSRTIARSDDERRTAGTITDRTPDEPTVSVVLPTRNRASTLPDAIKSVFAQTHQPLELVVVDGGSTDGTDQVLEAVNDDRIGVVRRGEPGGPSAARNVGIRTTEGEYIAFIDADDRWRPNKLERQLGRLEETNASVALSSLEKSAGEPRTRDGATGDVHDAIRRLDVPTYTSTLLTSRRAIESVGGFDESLACFEDWELCLRLSRSREFAFVEEPLVLKGTGDNNISAQPDRLASVFRTLDSRYDLPDCARAQFLADVGITYFEAGELSTGRPYVRQSLELDPRQPKAVVALALAATGSQAAFDHGMQSAYSTERLLTAPISALSQRLQALTKFRRGVDG